MADLRERLEAAVAGRYQLARELGRGGMATVFLARDLKHHRDVALKVLHAELAATLAAERFLREIEIAARLTHPHILPLHDSGEVDGLLFYVMPYVEGGSLRNLLVRERRLDLARCLAIVSPVADALGYAHRTGVVHRDIKPENILFSQGHPVVADFGIARAVSSAGAAGLTRTGFPLGTPGYMSPEQAAALDDPDARTDVFALAVLTYEMLVGELPGRWPSDAAVHAGFFLEASEAHRRLLRGAGSGVEAALVHAMAIQVEARTPTPADLEAELRGGTPRRRYREDEVREIVRRASELEATQPTVDPGMTIGGVQELAAEVGIPADLVWRAADQAALPAPIAPAAAPVPAAGRSPTVASGVLALSRMVSVDRVIAGEISPDDFPELVEAIREVMGRAGQVSQIGRTLEWTEVERFSPTDRNVRVTITLQGGRTRVLIREDLGPLVGMAYGGLMGGLGVVGMLLITAAAKALGEPGALIAVPLWFATMFVAARITVSASTQERRRQLARLAERLDALVRRLVPPPLPGPD
jgi:tRNA A-37 threonylcarbamoyl transferase component Bud32